MAITSIPTVFIPGVPGPEILLPYNGSKQRFTATLNTGLSGNVSLSACFDKFGVIWKWSTFETGTLSAEDSTLTKYLAVTNSAGLCALSSTFIPYPSSWNTMQCLVSAGTLTTFDLPGPYPKKWRPEGPIDANIFNDTPLCSATSIFWTISSSLGGWSDTRIIALSTSESFSYTLQLLDDGSLPYTASLYQDTPFVISAQLTAICANVPENDVIPVNARYDFTAIAPPIISLYTSNRYVLSGSEVIFENLITKTSQISSLVIDFDDGNIQTFTGDQITQGTFSTIYNVLGSKSIKVIAYITTSTTPIEFIFPDIVRVVAEYDEVIPTSYRTDATPLVLPWPDQPRVYSNDWVTEDNINSCFKKFYDNLDYLEKRGRVYTSTYSDYFGFLGPAAPTLLTNTGAPACDVWTWEDADCFNTSLPYSVTWRDVLSTDNVFEDGKFITCSTWGDQECNILQNPLCQEKFCLNWSWFARSRRNSRLQTITWAQTVTGGEYQKTWQFEPCSESNLIRCENLLWHVNIPQLDIFITSLSSMKTLPRCYFYGVASKDNKVFLAQKTQIKALSSDYNAQYFSEKTNFDEITRFSSLKNICVDSVGKIFVLDNILSRVGVYTLNPVSRYMDEYTSWGGYGSITSNTKFQNPNDIHIDILDNVWVCDTGNNCVKHYSNTGTWLRTIFDENFLQAPPLSLAVDKELNVHILTKNEIRVYTYDGAFVKTYSYKEYATTEPRKLTASYNKEMIYAIFASEVLRYFRNGVLSGYIIKKTDGFTNLNGATQDEYRNLLITSNDKLLKFPDLMTLIDLKGDLPAGYWPLNDILIHKEEYIQNWVYTKSFQRMWDNIEFFKATLLFNSEVPCKTFIPTPHGKEKMFIGQNEIVTSSTINRVLGYLWDNFNTMLNYFDPSCDL